MIYVATGVLVALRTNERPTPDVVRWYAGALDDRLASFGWSVSEVASALANRKRLGQSARHAIARPHPRQSVNGSPT